MKIVRKDMHFLSFHSVEVQEVVLVREIQLIRHILFDTILCSINYFLGAKYAMLSMKTTISHIVRNFRLETSRKIEDIETRIDLLTRSANGYPVKIVKRE